MFWLNSYQRNCLSVHLSLEPAHNKYGLCTTVSTVSEFTKMTQRSNAWCVSPSMPRRPLDIPADTYNCGAWEDTSLNDSKRCLGGAYHQHVWGNRSPPFLLDTNKDICYRVQPATTTLSPTEAALIYFPKFAKLPPPPRNPCHPINQSQKTCMEKHKWKPIFPRGRTVTSQGQFGGQHGVPLDVDGSENAFDWWVHHEGDCQRKWQGPNLKSAVSWHTGMIMLGLYYSENVYHRL